MQTQNEQTLQKAAQALKARFGVEVTISSADLLSEPERRNVLLRLHLKSDSKKVPTSVILKQSLPRESDRDDKKALERFARDWAGLEFANRVTLNQHTVPKFYGGDTQARFILVEDLGVEHRSLVDSLTASHRELAVSALNRFVKALANFHAAGFENTDLYNTILNKIHKNATSTQELLKEKNKELLGGLEIALQQLNMQITDQLIEEIHQVTNAMFLSGPFTVLTHGDAAPDNVFDHPDTQSLQLIDFEWAFVRNALLDGTYLRMSIPTGWCAKAIPEEELKKLDALYRDTISHTIEAAKDDQSYHTAYTQACAFHMLHELLNLKNIIKQDHIWPSGPLPDNSLWDPKTNLYRPRFLSRLQAFVDVAKQHQLLPHLTQMAEETLNKVKKLWPDAKPLEPYLALNTHRLDENIDSTRTHKLK